MTGRPATMVPSALDGSLVQRKSRIEALVREHHAFVWRSVRRLGVREADLDDAVQEVFLTVSKNVDQIEPGCERGYLFRTSIFVAAHARRSVQRRREIVDDDRVGEAMDASPTPEQSVATSEGRARLQAILDAMPEHLRAVFVLFELERTTMAAIAEMLSVPPGTVASRLRRAREFFIEQTRAVSTAVDDGGVA